MSRKKTEKEKPKRWKVKKSGIHRRGLFATADIEEGDRIIEYVGEKITKAESERRADTQLERADSNGDGAVYIFTLNKRHDIDGNVERNKARYANHSCDPNCETDVIKGRIWLLALQDIEKGEEIVYNYNFDLDLYEDHPCLCGSKRCVGYIVGEEYWPRLKKKLKKKKGKKGKG